MNKLYVMGVALCLVVMQAVPNNKVDRSVITDASYFIPDDQNKEDIIRIGVTFKTKSVTFYTATGDPLKTVSIEGRSPQEFEQMIDPCAPKPQPVFYAIKYWAAYPCRTTFGVEMIKGCPGDFIIFYDKHDNSIASYRYNRWSKSWCSEGMDQWGHRVFRDNSFSECKDLDLSKILYDKSPQLIEQEYKHARKEFKQELFNYQYGLMKRDTYFEFIELYLQEAERMLAIARYFKTHSESRLCKKYFTALSHYNVACFHNHVRSTAQRKRRLELYKKELLSVIEAVKAEGQLKNLDVQQELNKTIGLLQKANVHYYKKLNAGDKLKLWLMSFTVPAVRTLN